MEESEKRRERLRAMRAQASEAGGHSISQSPTTVGVLANPLADTPTVQDSSAPPRFDYYTDPMAAYSGNRQSNLAQSPGYHPPRQGDGRGAPTMQFPPSSLGPRNPDMTPHAHPARANFMPNRATQQARTPYHYNSGPIRGSRPMVSPYPEHQGHSFPNQSVAASGFYHRGSSPGGFNAPRPNTQWSRPSGPSFVPPHSSGRGNWVNTNSAPYPGSHGNPTPNMGRGRSNYNTGPGGSGQGVGRGMGYQSGGPSGFYQKSMVEDPWKYLTPVVWKGSNSTKKAELFQKFSSPPVVKKPRVAEPSRKPAHKKESLADYLAAASDEAVEEGDEAVEEKGAEGC